MKGCPVVNLCPLSSNRNV